MKRVEYKGYTAVQHHNKHMAIYNKGGKMVYYAQCAKKKTEAELKEAIDFYINFKEKGEL